MPLAIWWSTWKGRNILIFEGKARSTKVLDHGTKLNFLDFVDRIVVESLRG